MVYNLVCFNQCKHPCNHHSNQNIHSLLTKYSLMFLCNLFPLLAPKLFLFWCTWCSDVHGVHIFLWFICSSLLYHLQLLLWTLVVSYVRFASGLLNSFGLNIYILWKLENLRYYLFKYFYSPPFCFSIWDYSCTYVRLLGIALHVTGIVVFSILIFSLWASFE